ncbi:MAG TPA: hypothetical protein VNJ07_00970, partial [Chitinophagales bacterium]|nr:hypothetical protein [Chitinophagales bacterium]
MRGQKVPFFFTVIDTEAVKLKIARWLDDRFMREPEFFLVDVKVQGRKITVYLDGDRGITVDKCGEYSRYLESHLDEAMLAGVNYIL